jgi:hypothetical protein
MYTHEDFIHKANLVHNNKYLYPENYTKAHNFINIDCPIHGAFKQKAYSHLAGSGCPSCYNETRSLSLRKETDSFIKEAMLLHKSKYYYDKTIYSGNNKKLIITCKQHGDFLQTAAHHLKGSGCPKCKTKENKRFDDFTKQAKLIHQDKYEYTSYQGAHTKIEIICPYHGAFLQTPNSHLKGRGCPKCQFKNSSKLEKLWLDSLGIPESKRNKSIYIDSKLYKVDAFCSEANIIYEFYGDFWHGNPSKWKPDEINKKSNTTFGHLYYMTIQREKTLKSKGYEIISIWESDFLNKQETKQYKI